MSKPVEPGRGLTCAIGSLADALACSQSAGEFARVAGFAERGTWEVTIAVSELATNLVRHAGGGHIEIGLASEPDRGLTIVASDSGPGIADVSSAISDGYSRGRQLSADVPHGLRESLGSGLGAVERFTDELRIEAQEGGGTRVSAFKRLPEVPQAPASAPASERILVLGLGNAILCDDGVGIKVARYIADNAVHPGIDVETAELAGFALLDLLEGYDRAVIVDAVRMRDASPGDVNVFEASALEPSLHLVAGHQIDLPTALELGRRLERPLPKTVHVVGVQICDDTTFSETCTPAVEAAIPLAATIALRVATLAR